MSKNLTSALYLGTSCAWFALMATQPVMAQGASTENASENIGGIQEIIVTAQRREENLQDVPISVSAFSAEQLSARGTTDVSRLEGMVPGFTFGRSGSDARPAMRGVRTENIGVNGDTTIGFFVDGIYQSRASQATTGFVDIERVEVQRGPQGTLYGRNTTGGAIRVITAKPTNEFEGSAEASIGSFNRWHFKGSVNLPASDSLSFRLNGFIEKGDGWADNLFDGSEVNDTDGFGARVAVRWVPSDAFTGDLTFDYYKSDQAGLYGSDRGGIVRPATRDAFTVISGTDTSNVGRTYGTALTLNWKLSDALEVQSITGFRNVYQKWNLDLSDQPTSIFLLYTINDTDSISQELKLNGVGLDDKLKYTAGLFAYKEESFSFIGDQINLWFPFGRVPLPFFGRNYDVDVKSYAAFAEATYSITPRFRVIAGGRYTKDDKDLVIDARVGGTPGFAIGANDPRNYDCATLRGLGVPCTLDFSKFTPKLGLQFDTSDNSMVYLNYSKGWKSGGWSARTNNPREFVVFDPETVNSYELGVKTTVFDGRARLNYTAYRYDYEDFFSTATGTAGNFIVFTSDAVFQGVEFEGTARASDHLDLFTAIGIAGGKYKDRDPLVFGTSIGSEPQRVPRVSLKAGGTYLRPIRGDSQLRISADYQFLEDHYTNLQNSELARSSNVEVWNASAGLQFGDGKYDVSLSCRNCFDNEYISQSLDFSGLPPDATNNRNAVNNGLNFLVVYPGAPRSWALTFKAKF